MSHLLLFWSTSLHLQLGIAGPAPAVEHTLPAPATALVAEYITPAPMEFVEAALHEIDEEQCRDDFEELSYVARMSRMLLRMRQNTRGHGEDFRNVCVMRRVRRDEADVCLLWHVGGRR